MTQDPPKKNTPPTAWTFPPGTRPTPQSIAAGTRWAYRLPVTGPGDPPRCHWSSSLLKEGGHRISDDGLGLWVDIPPDETGVHKIYYRLDSEPPLEGFVLLKVMPPGAQPASAPGKAEDSPEKQTGNNGSEEKSSGEKQPSEDRAADRKKAADSEKKAEDIISDLLGGKTFSPPGPASSGAGPEPDDAPSPGPGTDADSASASAADAASAVDAVPAPKAASPATDAGGATLPPGNYFVTVYRDDVPIRQLRKPVEPHRSLSVGKFSGSKNIDPDLDLKPHFKSRELAKRCSREQARIYWREGRIVVKNLGKGDLALPGGDELESGGVHVWREGEPIRLPGGLTMMLEKEA